jgi:hypothetical protein
MSFAPLKDLFGFRIFGSDEAVRVHDAQWQIFCPKEEL